MLSIQPLRHVVLMLAIGLCVHVHAAELRTEARADVKTEARVDRKAGARADGKAGARADGKIEAGPLAKAVALASADAAAKANAKAQVQTGPAGHLNAGARADGKAGARTDGKTEARPLAQAVASASADAAAKADAKAQVQASPAGHLNAGARADGKAEARADGKTEARPLDQAVASAGADVAAKADTKAQVQAGPAGHLVIIGGALRDDTAPVWERIVGLAGGKGARIAVIPAAAGNPTRSGANIVRYLNRYGAAAFVLPVAPRLPGDVRKAANDPANVAAVRGAGGVYFAGGDQGRITAALRNPDGSNSAVLDSVWALYRRGGVVAGTSAGAAVMSSTMFYEAKPVLRMLQQGIEDGADIAPGLGFIGNDVFVDQHLLIRGRFARMLPVMLKKGYQLGLGVDENTAVVIKPDREAEVIGYKGVLVVDLSQASTDRQQTAFNVSNASISYLDKGDRFRLDTRAFLPGPDKVDGKLDPADPSYREPLYSADILGNTTLVDLMEKLIDSDQKQAIGLAFDGPRDNHPNPVGFEFRFSRAPDSIGYSSASSAAYSIFKVRLDVRPIALGWPSYRYR